MENLVNMGRLTYLNTIIFYLELEADSHGLRFIDGHPSELNQMLRKGVIDISPSSSIEFAMRPREYLVMPGISISSKSDVHSVLLFSKVPLASMDFKKISVTSASATSFALLRILLEVFMKRRAEYLQTSAPPEIALQKSDAVLLIGDAALTASSTIKTEFVYDLGRLWHKLTGLPCVFALWILRRDSYRGNKKGFRKIYESLLRAKKGFSTERYSLLERIPQSKWMKHDEILAYWETLSYDLTEEYLESIKKFYGLASRLNIIPRAPLLAFADV